MDKKRKLAKVVCRFCGPKSKPINRQSYRDHLRLAHNDKSGDLSEYGQAKINFFGGLVKEKKAVDGGEGDHDEETLPSLTDPEDSDSEDEGPSTSKHRRKRQVNQINIFEGGKSFVICFSFKICYVFTINHIF